MTIETERYKYAIPCHNCRDQIVLNIPKGTTVIFYLHSAKRKKEEPIICEYCGVERHPS